MSNMEILFFCPYWGSEDLDYKSFFEKVKNVSYHGVEMRLPLEIASKMEILDLLEQSGLYFIAQQ